MSGVAEASVGDALLSSNLTSGPSTTKASPSASSPVPGGSRTTLEVPQLTWMVRPCFLYKEEYKDCKSFKARFHQYFVEGKSTDCSQWKTDYDNCVEWEQEDNIESLKNVIASERQRVSQRLRNHYANNIWEHRTSPPEDWNKELPETIRKGYDSSYLKKRAEELKSGEETLGFSGDSGDLNIRDPEESSCTIM